ncbi:LrgB family protein [Simiduia agarivorans]|uniref:LrgB family protein n=1 Tax=Simiduia agarivorans (strain DSM 21679 / JCM 13881 / BCRC 17597 / SA1) TaxID=1117647 RepID=K4KNR2_SIMAS|nr:LrgB family protein [Simiduia agarivorans]AFU99743.1 LrgB family protein [Simiduia agarivorans SA1 = DSM 21679]
MSSNLFWLGCLLLTLAAYLLGDLLYQRSGRRLWLHPLATGSACIALGLWLAGVDYPQYRQASELFYLLLGLATVALAVPLHRELHQLKGLVMPVAITLVFGSAIACTTALVSAWLLGADADLLRALAPKSVTTPIALGLSQSLGANVSVTTGVVIYTGVFGALIASPVFRWAGLADPRLQGIVLGINAHGVGTARGFEISPVTGAFAGLGMGLTGAITALWLPYVIPWLI